MSSDDVALELLFSVCFLNSPEITVDHMGASVCLSPGKIFVPIISQNLSFFSYMGHMLEFVTSVGIVPSSESSSGALIRTYVCCYSYCSAWNFPWMIVGVVPIDFFKLFFIMIEWCCN